MPDRTTQVEVIVFKIINGEILFLLLKRTEQRGGFWQPVTGGVHEGESLVEAVKRELLEETGIKDFIHIYNDIHSFEFDLEKYGTLKECVFGVRIADNIDAELSPEHTEMKWCSLDESLDLLKYDGNKVGFKKLAVLTEAMQRQA